MRSLFFATTYQNDFKPPGVRTCLLEVPEEKAACKKIKAEKDKIMDMYDKLTSKEVCKKINEFRHKTTYQEDYEASDKLQLLQNEQPMEECEEPPPKKAPKISSLPMGMLSSWIYPKRDDFNRKPTTEYKANISTIGSKIMKNHIHCHISACHQKNNCRHRFAITG
jgi:beta-mannanase